MKKFALAVLMALTMLSLAVLSASAWTPKNHEEYMKNEYYKNNFEDLAALIRNIEENYTPAEFKTFVKENDEAIAALVKEYMEGGASEVGAYEMAYEERHRDVDKELRFEWLRKNATGVQGLYRLKTDGFEGYMTVSITEETEEYDAYMVEIFVNMTFSPYNSGFFDGVSSKLSGNTITVPYHGYEDGDDIENAVTITFDGENANVTSSQPFKERGALGARVILDGTYVRERKTAVAPAAKAADAQDVDVIQVVVTGDGVNVRSAPSTKGNVHKKVHTGEYLLVEPVRVRDSGDNSEWYKILFTYSLRGRFLQTDKMAAYNFSSPYISARFVKNEPLTEEQSQSLRGVSGEPASQLLGSLYGLWKYSHTTEVDGSGKEKPYNIHEFKIAPPRLEINRDNTIYAVFYESGSEGTLRQASENAYVIFEVLVSAEGERFFKEENDRLLYDPASGLLRYTSNPEFHHYFKK